MEVQSSVCKLTKVTTKKGKLNIFFVNNLSNKKYIGHFTDKIFEFY